MDKDKIDKLMKRCERVEEYLIHLPDFPPEYIRIEVFKELNGMYWANRDVYFWFYEETDACEWMGVEGKTPEDAFKESVDIILKDYQKSLKKPTKYVDDYGNVIAIP